MTTFFSGNPHPPLDREHVVRLLAGRSCEKRLAVHVFDEVDSTNRVIKDLDGDYVAVLAEAQSHGRGRRGRGWIATPRCNILLSVSRALARPGRDISGLSLAAGVSMVDALQDCGISGVGLKWPNDLMVGRAKLGGVLIETSVAEGKCTRVVIGLGLNVYLSKRDLAELPGETVDLYRHTNRLIDRNRLAANLIARLYEMLDQFEASGFGCFQRSWESLHVFQQQRVTLLLPQGVLTGMATGIDARGRLMLRSDAGETSYWETGEVSLRA